MKRVAPRTGAWIETNYGSTNTGVTQSPPARGRGSKPMPRGTMTLPGRRPPHGGVDRNWCGFIRSSTFWGRPPHGGVDRNNQMECKMSAIVVAPRTGAWIETKT